MNNLFSTSLLSLSLLASAACDAQVDPDYRGEPLATLTGEVVALTSASTHSSAHHSAFVEYLDFLNRIERNFLVFHIILHLKCPAIQLECHMPHAYCNRNCSVGIGNVLMGQSMHRHELHRQFGGIAHLLGDTKPGNGEYSILARGTAHHAHSTSSHATSHMPSSLIERFRLR